MGISVFLWFLVRLSKDYTYTINYTLKYTHIPENYRLISSSDSILTMKIKVQGFDFFTEEYLTAHKRTFEVSLKGIRTRPHDHHLTGYITTAGLGKEIATQANFPFETYGIAPDTLFFTFEPRSIRKMPVIRYDSIIVSKPDQQVDTAHTYPDSIRENGLKP
jgi:hypothetical protein